MGMRLALLLIAANQVVLVPSGGEPAECTARTRLAAAAALSPKLRVLRVALGEGEALEAARARTQADWALDGRQPAELSEVETAGPDGPRRAQGRGPGGIAAALAEVWPKGLDRPPSAGWAGAPNPEALSAACAKDAKAAYEAAGAAVTPGLADLVAPADALRQGTLMQRWAWAKAQGATPAGCAKALPALRATTYGLEQGHLPPIWRRPPRDERRPSEMTRLDSAWVLFEDGRFFAVDPASGQALWQREVPTAEPAPTRLEAGYLALVTSQGLTVIQAETGTTSWAAELKSPSAELALIRGQVVACGTEEVVAYDQRSGAVRWRYDGLSRPAAGPVVVQGLIVAPLYSRLVVLDPDDGHLLREVELGDEITAPLLVSDDQAVWVAIGADQLARVDPRTGNITFKSRDVYGLAWPPTVLAGRLVASLQSGRGVTELAFVDPTEAKSPRLGVRGLHPPLIGLADYSGFVHAQERPWSVVARDMRGQPRWQTRQAQEIRALSAPGDLVVAGVGRRVIVLDRKRGTPLWQSEFEAPVLDVRFDQDGGVVALDNGALYGLPGGGDPRLSAHLEAARLDLAACQLELRQTSAAEKTAEQVLGRAPGQLDALHLLAQVAERARRPDAVARWLSLADHCRPADPLAPVARAALDRLAGIQGQVRPDGPFKDLAALTEGRAFGRGERGTAWVDLSTGAMGDGEPPQPAEPVATQPASVDGLPKTGLRVLFQDATMQVLSGTTAAALTALVDLQTQQVRWQRELNSPVRGVWPGPEALLLDTEGGLLGLDAATGKQRFRLPARGDDTEVIAHLHGWLMVDKDRLSSVNAAGRATFTLKRDAHHRGLRVVPDLGLAFVWTDRELSALDLSRGQRRGRIEGIEVQDVLLTPSQGVAGLSDGSLLVFEPQRALLPER